ncbi:MAG: Gfo/Idh/MocA family oxidoreductase [Acidobacteria bacterium]|nr:Gfo/Idh/MocA family oxidoreductase [Acidobacteriota bacterium]
MEPTNERRAFLGSAAAGLLILKPETVFGSAANSTVEVGLIGCGGRGNWISPFFVEFTGARFVALADVQKAHLDTTREKLKVGASRAYYGPDAYKELAASKLDAVIIETPPLFHPEHAEAAVAAGKHVFLAKPVAVDVPGCKGILASGAKAKQKNLSFLVDFQTRAQPVFQECAQRVQRGDIGKPAMGQVFYFAGRPAADKRKPGMDPGQGRVLNFYMDRALGGDIIVEQNIHVIDVANWYLNSHPDKAHGTGGRTNWKGTKFDAGDAYDHFVISFWYPGDVHVSFASHQLTRTFPDMCIRCFGIDGAVDSHYGGLVKITGPNAWVGAEKDDTFRSGAINNAKAFIQSVRDGKPVNNTETAVESNLTAILGRMAAYQQKTVTWAEMMSSTERLSADLKLRW